MQCQLPGECSGDVSCHCYSCSALIGGWWRGHWSGRGHGSRDGPAGNSKVGMTWVFLSLEVPLSPRQQGWYYWDPRMHNFISVQHATKNFCAHMGQVICDPVSMLLRLWAQAEKSNHSPHIASTGTSFLFQFPKRHPFSPGVWHLGLCSLRLLHIPHRQTHFLPSLPSPVTQEATLYGLFSQTPLPAGFRLGLVNERHQWKRKRKEKGIRIVLPCFTSVWRGLWPSLLQLPSRVPSSTVPTLGSGNYFLLLSLYPKGAHGFPLFLVSGCLVSLTCFPYPCHTTVA